jgi:hypothetical protein
MRKAVRDDQVVFRLSVPLKIALKVAADEDGLELSDFCRLELIKAIRARWQNKGHDENSLIRHQADSP